MNMTDQEAFDYVAATYQKGKIAIDVCDRSNGSIDTGELEGEYFVIDEEQRLFNLALGKVLAKAQVAILFEKESD